MLVGIANPWWRGKCSWHSLMCNLQFYVSGKRPMADVLSRLYAALCWLPHWKALCSCIVTATSVVDGWDSQCAGNRPFVVLPISEWEKLHLWREYKYTKVTRSGSHYDYELSHHHWLEYGLLIIKVTAFANNSIIFVWHVSLKELSAIWIDINATDFTSYSWSCNIKLSLNSQFPTKCSQDTPWPTCEYIIGFSVVSSSTHV